MSGPRVAATRNPPGGGVAALLAHALNTEAPLRAALSAAPRVRCVAVAPPALASAPLAAAMAPYVTSVMRQHDIIPHCSLAQVGRNYVGDVSLRALRGLLLAWGLNAQSRVCYQSLPSCFLPHSSRPGGAAAARGKHALPRRACCAARPVLAGRSQPTCWPTCGRCFAVISTP
jgi:hypothetical protein